MQDNNISTKLHWTESAIECYERGYDCFGCPTQKLLESGKCQMKDSVLKLIAIKGLPPKDDDLFPQFKNRALKIMKLINGGVDTLEELASELETTRHGILSCINAEIIPYYENQGFLRKIQALKELEQFEKDKEITNAGQI